MDKSGMIDRVVIIGAGQAGAQAAISLRHGGYKGAVDMIGAEEAPPYQRPPLSKAYLKGELEEARLYLRGAEFYEIQNVRLHLGVKATGVDRKAKTVVTDAGGAHAYDALLLATGAPPRRLAAPGADLRGVHYLRTHADSDALRPMLSAPGRILIVGAGYIGLEVAAVARQAGRDVTVLEMAPRVLARVASEPVSHFYENLHRGAGVDLRLGAAFESFTGEVHVQGARLKSGEEIDCIAVLVGIGAAPEVSLAKKAGLVVDNGIVVDEHARTSDPAIFAAGDCTNFPSLRYGRRMRLESVPNAIEQAKVAAANMIGGDVVYDALPWFWSDQYDVKLQTVGLLEGHDDLVVRGDPSAKKFAVWYLKEGRALAVDAINDPASFAMGKKLILAETTLDKEKLADASVDLRTLG
jgi:3-phenylpropionate/trans-cinnamate dioxygenase ferredoxin reductase subunit